MPPEEAVPEVTTLTVSAAESHGGMRSRGVRCGARRGRRTVAFSTRGGAGQPSITRFTVWVGFDREGGRTPDLLPQARHVRDADSHGTVAAAHHTGGELSGVPDSLLHRLRHVPADYARDELEALLDRAADHLSELLLHVLEDERDADHGGGGMRFFLVNGGGCRRR